MSANQVNGVVYLIPAPLHEAGEPTIAPYVLEAVKRCQVFFVENERSARRFLKGWWREMVIEDYQWFAIHKAEESVVARFNDFLRSGMNVGIISEAGCPGIADPGQKLVSAAHAVGATVKPLVGPSSILLALMASGLNGQSFQFNGYLPIDAVERSKTLKQLENESAKKRSTQLFIETPYRNNQLLETIFKTLQPGTWLTIAVALTSQEEKILTKRISDWKKDPPNLHKKPVIFCFLAG